MQNATFGNASVLTDFTMWREINIFISVQYWSCVFCLVNTFMYFTLTISLKKKIRPRLYFKKSRNVILEMSTAVCNWFNLNQII